MVLVLYCFVMLASVPLSFPGPFLLDGPSLVTPGRSSVFPTLMTAGPGPSGPFRVLRLSILSSWPKITATFG